MTLVSKFTNHIKDQGQGRTEQDRCCERKIKSRVLALVMDITGKAAERNIGAPKQQEECSEQYEQHSAKYQEFAEIGHHRVSPTFHLILIENQKLSLIQTLPSLVIPRIANSWPFGAAIAIPLRDFRGRATPSS